MLSRFWQTVINPDFNQHTDISSYKRSALTHQLSCVAFGATLVFSLFNFIIGRPSLGYLNLSFVPFYALATWLNWTGKNNWSKSSLVMITCLAVFVVSSTQGRHSGNNLLYLPIYCGIFVLFSAKDRLSFILHASVPVVCLITLELTDYSLLVAPSFLTKEASPFLINFFVCIATFWLCINYLMTTTQETEATLRESETNLLAVIENTTDSIWSINEAGQVLTWNSTFQKYFHSITGVNLATGLALADYFPQEEKPFWVDIYSRGFGGERFVKEIHQSLALGKENVRTEISVNPIVKTNGKVSGISFIAKNVTERKQAEEKLRFHAGILANVHDAVIGLDNEYRITYWNEGAELQYGWKEKAILGKKLREAYTFHWLNDNHKDSALESLYQTGQSRTEMSHILKNGQRIYVDITTQLWYDELGNAIGLLALIRDITQAKQAQKDIKHQSRLLKVILDNMPVILYRITSDGVIRESWGAGLKTLQHQENESAGKSIYALHPQITPELMAIASEQLITFETSGFTNEQVWHFENFLFSSDTNRLICFAQDITERKRTEETIKQNHAKLTAIIESTQHAIFALDVDYRYSAFNSRHAINMKKMYGTDIKLGMSLIEAQKAPLDWENFLVSAKRALSGETFSLVEEYGHAALYRTYFEIAFNPIRNENNEITGIAVFSQDITDRKKAEDDMRRINFELDSFVYRSSHDLRAPLRSLLGLTNLLRTEKDEVQQNLYLSLIDKSVNKLDTFIADMTNFSRNSRQVLSIEPIDFDKIIKDCAENLRYMDNADRVSLRMNIQVEAPFFSDILRISTVLQNLLSNSVKYQRTHIDNGYVQFDIHCNEQRALIVYSDNGKGIEAAYLDKVFDMFFRASSDSYGSGLGLYIVKQVVEKLQGEIKIESTIGEGTTFTLSLPNLEVHPEDIDGQMEEQVG
ncbi:MAG: PAS domain-containing sensor histidine kinase [Bacteroidota bacterium]